jgi:hypothetical protein
LSATLDGFIELDEAQLIDGMARGLKQLRNELSPFVVLPPADGAIERDLLADQHYGQIFEGWVREARGIYGAYSQLPLPAGHQHATRGYHSVPYRLIPRIPVSDREELLAHLQRFRFADPKVFMLLRGQPQEYLLGRASRTNEVLFDRADATEPSLPPSSERAGIDMNALLPEWLALLDGFLWAHSPEDKRDYLQRYSQTYPRALLGLSLAQHYGLPSAGLDVSGDLDIALFFALTRFRRQPGRLGLVPERIGPADEPVLYVFMTPEKFAFGHRELGLAEWIPAFRPLAQDAYFLHTGWGMSRNENARHIVAALYLDPAGDYGEIPAPAEVFPDPDPFALYLDRVRTLSLSFEMDRALQLASPIHVHYD